MIVMVALPVLLWRRILLREVPRLDTLQGYLRCVFLRVVDVLAVVPEACWYGDALDLDGA
jgi:hypothetical protein